MALFDAFLKLDGIKGESQDKTHKGEIDILSFSWGCSQTGTMSSGGGGGAGKVRLHEFQIVKRADKSSPDLMINCATGKPIATGNFVVRKAGGTQLEYLKIKLTDVMVTNYSSVAAVSKEYIQAPDTGVTDAWDYTATAPGSSAAIKEGLRASGGEIPTESVSFTFSKIEFDYQPQGADGAASGGAIHGGWDVKANVKV